MKLLFVGEQPSKTAAEKGWQWGDEHLCSKTLLEALDNAGVHRSDLQFINLFTDGKVSDDSLAKIKSTTHPVIGMGRKVQKVLARNAVRHIPLVHPAARGLIRKKRQYQLHVRGQFSFYRELMHTYSFETINV